MTLPRRLRHIKPPLLAPKSRKANRQSASRAGSAIKVISIRGLAAVSGLRQKPRRRPPSAVHPAPRVEAQGQRRVHGTFVQNPSPGPQLRRRSRLVEEAGYRSRRHVAAALDFDPVHRAMIERVAVPLDQGSARGRRVLRRERRRPEGPSKALRNESMCCPPVSMGG